MEERSFIPRNHLSPGLNDEWIEIQDSLKKSLIAEDDFSWNLPENFDDSEAAKEDLKYVCGVDLSFSKSDSSIACATVVVLDMTTLQVIYEDSALVELRVPYIPGFLAFREAPVLLELLDKMKKKDLPSYPQLLMVDGNGLLHPQGFGLACHLGVLAGLPTIGIGKNLHHVDGLTQSKAKQMLEAEEASSKDVFTLIGGSGSALGAVYELQVATITARRIVGERLSSLAYMAMRSTQGSVKPIFISVGHRISLTTAIKVVKLTCKYRVPEPIRQADIRSKEWLRKHGLR